MKSLLKKALSTESRKLRDTQSPEEIELAQAWLDDIVNLTQVQRAMNMPHGSGIYIFLAKTLKHMYKVNNANRTKT